MDSMFCECLSLKKLNISNFNINNATNINNLFYKCKSLKLLYINNYNDIL